MDYKGKILIVEDDFHLLDGVRDILELEGYEVLTARDGRSGLEVLRAALPPPNLIISDIMMPNMDGLQFLQAVRADEQWITIPFIFLTAKGEKEDVQAGRKLGVDDYLTKPFDSDDLLIAVESRLRRYQRIDDTHANRISGLKRNILTILNHEFRTPLTLIVAYANMLNEGEPTQLSGEELLLFLKGVNSGAERLRHLVENFILLVEIQTGEAAKIYAMRRKPQAVEPLISEARRRALLREEVTHDCVIEMDNDLPKLRVDGEYLITALTHLIDNAIKFSPNHDSVTVHVTQSNESLRIAVKDRGRGIPAAEVARIWDSFYQINREMHEDQGAGSGLAIAAGLVALHGGHIDVESQQGMGSTFTIVLPFE